MQDNFERLKSLHPSARLQEDGGWLAETADGRFFTINAPTAEILEAVRQSASAEEALARCTGAASLTLPVFDRLLAQLNGIFAPSSKSRESYVGAQVTLLSASASARLGGLLAGLFNNAVLLTLFPAATVACIAILLAENANLSFTLLNIAHSLPLFFAMGLVHEIGHAAAMRSAGGMPGRVGVGFYGVMPVFFCDLTSLWALERRKRLRVNAGGIYFQLLFTVAAYAASWMFDSRALLAVVFFSIAGMVFQLLPFVRSDGYWMLCDAINEPRLLQHSREACVRLFRRGRSRPGRREWMLAAYGGINALAFAAVSASLLAHAGTSAVTLYRRIQAHAPDAGPGLHELGGIDAYALLSFLFSILLVGRLARWFRLHVVRSGSFMNHGINKRKNNEE